MTTRSTIVARLQSVARLERVWQAVRGLGWVSVAVCAASVLAITLEAWLHTPIAVRTVLWYMVLTSAVVSMVALVLRPLILLVKTFTEDQVSETALRVGREYTDLGDMLCNVLQLTGAASTKSDLAEAAYNHVAAVAQDKDFSVIVDRRKPRFAALLGLLTAAITVGGITLWPSVLGAAWERIVQYDRSFQPPAPFRLVIEPLRDTVMRGAQHVVRVTAIGTPPESVTLHVRQGNSDRFEPFTLRRDTGASFTYMLPGMTVSVEYYAESPWLEIGVRSDTGRITVLDRPLVRSIEGRIAPPSYSRLPIAEFTEQSADITALRGSQVSLNVQSNKDLSSASVMIVAAQDSTSDTTVVPLSTRGRSGSASFTVQRNSRYAIRLRDASGTENAEPMWYTIVALTDASPTISLVEPTGEVELTQKAAVPITVTIADDYGFSSLRLYYRLTQSRYAQPEKTYRSIDIPFKGDAVALDVAYVWDLAQVDVTPEDAYEFYIEVADNDRISGPKTAKTATISVRMPSLDEVFSQADKTQEQARQELKNLAKEAEEVRREAEQLQREMQKQQSQQRQDVNWSEKKKAQELLQRQEQLQKRMENVMQQLDQMTEKLQENKAISKETLEKYMELQKLMQEVKNPELERMQEQMRKAMENMNPEELQKMMKDFKFNEEEFRKNIERQLSLLKRMQVEQKTEELERRAEDLARKQDELRDRAQNSNPNNKEENKKLAEEQRRLEEDLKRLSQEAKELEKMMKEAGRDMPAEKMDQAQKDLNAQETQQQMDQAASDMEKGDRQNSSQKQQQASQNLQRFAQQMKNMKREMRRNSQREAMRQMQRGVNDLVDLSKQQEALREQMQGMDPNSAQYPQMAQKQQKLSEAMQNIANSMMQLGQKSASVTPDMAQDMGDALQAMKDAMQSMADRNGPQAMKNQAGAMSSMNSAAQRMSESLGSMMQGEGSGQGGSGQQPGQGEGRGQSPFQRLQRLADEQQSINEGMQRLGQNGRSTDEQQRAELGRLASQQGRAQKALQELEQERKKIVGEKKPLGDLQQISKDMEEVMSDMQSGSITPETRQRQERILSRLLDASRSMNDRDYEKSRESNAGQDVVRKSPAQLQLERESDSMRAATERVRQGYSKDYENLIRQYFEALQRQRVGGGAQR